MIEMALGHYPYPPETYANVFAQLTAIVHGDPPELPDDGYSDEARDFVARCLHRVPDMRATYRELLVRSRRHIYALRGANDSIKGTSLPSSRSSGRCRHGRVGR